MKTLISFRNASAVARVAIEVALLAIAAVLVLRLVALKRAAASEGVDLTSSGDIKLLTPGERLELPGVDWSSSSRTVVTAIETNCPGCVAQTPFYQQLSKRIVKSRDVSLVVVGPESQDRIQKWLTAREISARIVPQLSEAPRMGFRSSPMYLIVDVHGVVRDSWVGSMSPKIQNAFLGRALDNVGEPITNIKQPTHIGQAELDRVVAAGGVLLDVRERPQFMLHHVGTALNIPADELILRAHEELPSGAPVVVDCTVIRPDLCLKVAKLLIGLGMSPVDVVTF